MLGLRPALLVWLLLWLNSVVYFCPTDVEGDSNEMVEKGLL